MFTHQRQSMHIIACVYSATGSRANIKNTNILCQKVKSLQNIRYERLLVDTVSLWVRKWSQETGGCLHGCLIEDTAFISMSISVNYISGLKIKSWLVACLSSPISLCFVNAQYPLYKWQEADGLFSKLCLRNLKVSDKDNNFWFWTCLRSLTKSHLWDNMVLYLFVCFVCYLNCNHIITATWVFLLSKAVVSYLKGHEW